MRTLLVAVLLAGAATQAIAAPEERTEREKAERPSRAERPAPRPQRAQRQDSEPRDNSDQRQPLRLERSERVERPVQPPGRGDQRPLLKKFGGGTADVEPVRPQRVARDSVAIERPATPDSVRDWRPVERRRVDRPSSIEERNLRRAPGIGDGLVEQTRPLPPVLDRTSPRRVGKIPAPGTQPPPPPTVAAREAEPDRHWRHDWRRDRRYDWRDHRRRHRDRFRLAIYFDPFGWNYRRYGIGWRLWPSYYSSRFWLHDPWSYRLPPAYGPYRWIRYWDDALLVNIYTGQVVDVIHDVFW